MGMCIIHLLSWRVFLCEYDTSCCGFDCHCFRIDFHEYTLSELGSNETALSSIAPLLRSSYTLPSRAATAGAGAAATQDVDEDPVFGRTGGSDPVVRVLFERSNGTPDIVLEETAGAVTGGSGGWSSDSGKWIFLSIHSI